MIIPPGTHCLALKFVSRGKKAAPAHLHTGPRGFAENRWQTDRATRCPEEAMMAQRPTHPLLTRQDAIWLTES